MARPQVRAVLVLGPLALREELAAAGLSVCEDAAHPVDAVVVGRDDAFSYARLCMAQEAVFSGACLLATDGDRHVPRRDGLRPGTAVITAAVEAACFTSATVVGKPAPDLLRQLMAGVGAAPATTVVVGDSIVTDIAAAAALGLYSVYVLSGIAQSHPEPLTCAPSLTLASVASLIPALEHTRPDLLKVEK
jgi:4-nitrophenyl phosphatase